MFYYYQFLPYFRGMTEIAQDLLPQLIHLNSELEGDLFYDQLMRTLYATDASVYRELPLSMALAKSEEDTKKLSRFAREHKTSLIPRTAGTSLAGQCEGEG